MKTTLDSTTVRTSWLTVGEDTLLLAAVAPDPGAASFDAQAASLYAEARIALEIHGFAQKDVVGERLFLSDAPRQAARARGLRGEAGFGAAALTVVGQPPAEPGHLCALQLTAVRGGVEAPHGHQTHAIDTLSIRRVTLAGSRMVFVSGAAASTPHVMSAEQEAAAMYLQAARALASEGLSFRNVVRTWIHLKDIDRDYAALNRARRLFYEAQGVAPPPASTGIGGVPEREGRFSLDLVAMLWGPDRRPAAMHARSMNEAPSYGADFSRGTRVELQDTALLFLSGTASIDPHGEVAHVGDIDRQARCMLDRVTDLLERQGAGPRAIVQAVTYLKDRSYLGALREALEEKGFPAEIPHTICVADVCRPAWLCEMESLAVAPIS